MSLGSFVAKGGSLQDCLQSSVDLQTLSNLTSPHIGGCHVQCLPTKSVGPRPHQLPLNCWAFGCQAATGRSESMGPSPIETQT